VPANKQRGSDVAQFQVKQFFERWAGLSENSNFFQRVGNEVAEGGRSGHRSRRARHWEDREALHARTEESMSGEKRWAANHDIFWGATQTYDGLPAGLYRCGTAEGVGPVLLRQTIEMDDAIELPDHACASIIREFEKFWKIEPEFRKRGFLAKRGYLLWGGQGAGKTVLINLLTKRVIDDHDGVVLFIDSPREASACLRMLRQIEPRRPVVAIMEELDALVEKYGESEFLALLDGEAQVNRIVFLASTNFPERLDRRFVARPSRFDTVGYVGPPSAESRRVFLETKEPSLSPEELDLWVKRSEGFPIAYLKEMIIAVKCLHQPLEDVIERLELMHERQLTSESASDRKSTVGFTRRSAA
jgi:hypothetical protein